MGLTGKTISVNTNYAYHLDADAIDQTAKLTIVETICLTSSMQTTVNVTFGTKLGSDKHKTSYAVAVQFPDNVGSHQLHGIAILNKSNKSIEINTYTMQDLAVTTPLPFLKNIVVTAVSDLEAFLNITLIKPKHKKYKLDDNSSFGASSAAKAVLSDSTTVLEVDTLKIIMSGTFY